MREKKNKVDAGRRESAVREEKEISKQKNRIKNSHMCFKGKSMSTILYPRFQNPQSQVFLQRVTVIPFGGKHQLNCWKAI